MTYDDCRDREAYERASIEHDAWSAEAWRCRDQLWLAQQPDDWPGWKHRSRIRLGRQERLELIERLRQARIKALRALLAVWRARRGWESMPEIEAEIARLQALDWQVEL